MVEVSQAHHSYCCKQQFISAFVIGGDAGIDEVMEMSLGFQVQGEAAVKSYMVRPGMSVILLDLDNPNRMYVKACNMAGVPIFTEGFDLGKIQLGQPVPLNDDRYVPREEYEKSMNQIAQLFVNFSEMKEENHE